MIDKINRRLRSDDRASRIYQITVAQKRVLVSLFASLVLVLSKPFCRLEVFFSLGPSWTVQERWEFIFTSAFLVFGFDRSSRTWILMNLHSSFCLDRLLGVAFLLRALTDRPIGFLSTSSPSVLRATPPNFNLRLITGLSLELFSEFLRD